MKNKNKSTHSLAAKLQTILAKDIMTRKVITTTEDTRLSSIGELMIKTRISGLPVKNKKGKIIGIITANDLFMIMDMIKSGDIIGKNLKDIYNPTVKFAMSTQVVKISKTTTLDEIIAIMKYKNIHTLPVFEGTKMVGVIGRRDVFKNFYFTIKDLKL